MWNHGEETSHIQISEPDTGKIMAVQELVLKSPNIIKFDPSTFLSLFLFLYFLYKWVQIRSAPRKNLPPSPPKLPVLGNLHQLGTYPHRALHTLSERYGELMLIHLGKAPLLVVSSAKLACEIMKTHDAAFANRPRSKNGVKLFYNCRTVASAPYGEYWRQAKSICVLQLLSNKRVQSFRSIREEETALLMEKIGKSNNSAVNLSDMFRTYTNDVMCRVAFGRKYNGEQDENNFKRLLEELVQFLARFKVGDSIPWLAWTNKLNGWDSNVDKVAKAIDQFLEKVLNDHQAQSDVQSNSTNNQHGEKGRDFVDVLLEFQRNNTSGLPIERESIKAIILDMFTGGIDTTYTVLEWVVAELLRHPRALKELQKEVREITSKKTQVEETDLDQMKYLKAVIKETLRLHPPIPTLVPRQSTRDAKIDGYEIPAGTRVIINAWAIHRDPALWKEPDKFQPERFLESPIDFRGQDFQFIPFGSGRRVCPGISFALANDELVLANLMHKFDWTLPDGETPEHLDMAESIGVTIHRKTPLLAVATAHNFDLQGSD